MENKKQKTTTTSTFQSLSGVFRLRQKLLTEFTAPLHNGIQERFKSDPIKVSCYRRFNFLPQYFLLKVLRSLWDWKALEFCWLWTVSSASGNWCFVLMVCNWQFRFLGKIGSNAKLHFASYNLVIFLKTLRLKKT